MLTIQKLLEPLCEEGPWSMDVNNEIISMGVAVEREAWSLSGRSLKVGYASKNRNCNSQARGTSWVSS